MNEKLDTTPLLSYWPILLALAVLLIAVGVVSTFIVSIFGLFLLFVTIIGWVWENREMEPEDENGG
jgi:hypothetical protein